MHNIRTAILAACLGTIASLAAHAQYDSFGEGPGSLASNTAGSYDAAFGVDSMYSNNEGEGNAAIGTLSLYTNTNGSYNTAAGSWSLYGNNGSYNTGGGSMTLYQNTGVYNTASGYAALYSNQGGGSNTAVGSYALLMNTTGSNNIAIGSWAGYSLSSSSSNNIDIANDGSANDSGVIRIGSNGNQSAFFVGGVRGVTTGSKDAIEVMIDQNGQLGTKSSSIRFKEDVHDMAAASDGLMRLRPVTYRYKQPYADGSKPIDYGLIAEEVAEVYPDLVARDADGQIQTVQYQKLTPMLLNEVQKEHKLLEQQAKTIELLEKRLAALESAQPSANQEARLVAK
jgi:hypothetical protein